MRILFSIRMSSCGGLKDVGRVESLATHQGDSFDRLLIAQALEEKLPVITADPTFPDYGVKRIW